MKKAIFGNIWLKLLAIVLSVSLWFFVTYRGQWEMPMDARVTFRNVPKGLEILKSSANSVTLNIRGHERILKSLRPMDVGAVIDLSTAKKGESVYYIEKDVIVVPRTVDVIRVDPTSVRVTLDEYMAKMVPVKASMTGAPDKGYRVVSVEVTPSMVKVEGAKTELARVAFLRTEPVDISGLDSAITESVRLNTSGKNIRTKVPEVTLRITIRKQGG